MSHRSWDVRAGARCDFSRAWPGAGQVTFAALRTRIGHVDVVIADDAHPHATPEEIRALLAGAPRALTRALRRVVICTERQRPAVAPGAPRPPALCDLRGGIWHIIDPADPARALHPELVHHELAHCAGGPDGGPPGDLAAGWERAGVSDTTAARGRLRIDRAREVGGMLLGAGAVSTYARESGPVEDWADAIALAVRERRTGRPLIPADLADHIAPARRAPGPVCFADLWPARARIIDAFLDGPERHGR